MPDNSDPLVQTFEAQRDRLRTVAYRMLGSHADAEDVVQEAWLRLARQDAAEIGNLAGWLTTVVGRISLDVLRSRRTRPEAPFEDLSGLVVTADDRPGPDDDAALADSVGLALMIVLDSLGPNERLAFVLHDLFGVRFDEIGRIVGSSADAAKMMASRARRKVREGEAPAGPDGERRRVVDAFLAASRGGDFEGLLRVLDPEVRLTVHTPGGVVVTLGATEVAGRAGMGAAAAVRGRRVMVHGLHGTVGVVPGVVSWREDGTALALLAFTVVGDRITAIAGIADPVRLAALDLPGLE